jgi:hypothetical protein
MENIIGISDMQDNENINHFIYRFISKYLKMPIFEKKVTNNFTYSFCLK